MKKYTDITIKLRPMQQKIFKEIKEIKKPISKSKLYYSTDCTCLMILWELMYGKEK